MLAAELCNGGVPRMTSFCRFALRISPEETTFARRHFFGLDPIARERLEQIGRTFLGGYHAALAQDEPEDLSQVLNTTDSEFRGFAFEGAAMGLSLLDRLMPWRKQRLQPFLEGPGLPHVYLLHVGIGWALARLPWTRRGIERSLGGLHPLLRWLAVDGFGFHQGYFYWRRYVEQQAVPDRLSACALRVFDQGLGRSLWFVDGADIDRIARTIGAFAAPRRPDLWRGVGLACAYAGGVDRVGVEAFRRVAQTYIPQLAQGAAFAAKARERAANPAECTDVACEVLCGVSAREAAAVTDAALADLPTDGPEPAYEVWQRRIQARFAEERVGELKS